MAMLLVLVCSEVYRHTPWPRPALVRIFSPDVSGYIAEGALFSIVTAAGTKAPGCSTAHGWPGPLLPAAGLGLLPWLCTRGHVLGPRREAVLFLG